MFSYPVANVIKIPQTALPEFNDFCSYLEHSLRNPFVLDLKDYNLIGVIKAYAKARSTLHPSAVDQSTSLIYNIRLLESAYNVTLYPIQITDIFWGYFVQFLQDRGLRATTISVMCARLKSILTWAAKYNATISPTYADLQTPATYHSGIALTADDVSRIAYFDIDLFYKDRRSDFRKTIKDVRNMFVLGCNLGQRHSDLVRIDPSCFERNIFTIVQQKTGNKAIVNIDTMSIEPKTTYRILEEYGYTAPYKCTIGNYNYYLHQLMKDIGFTEAVKDVERIGGGIVTKDVPKWKKISSHTCRRTFLTVNVMRGKNLYQIKKASGHSSFDSLEIYLCDSE